VHSLRQCVRMCSEIQGVNALGQAGRGFNTVVMPAYDMPFAKSVCTTCGQCINVCPTASFVEKNYSQELFAKLNDASLVKVAQIAPSVRAAIGEGFGLQAGKNMEGQTVAALRSSASITSLTHNSPRFNNRRRSKRISRTGAGKRQAAHDNFLLQRVDEIYGTVLSRPD